MRITKNKNPSHGTSPKGQGLLSSLQMVPRVGIEPTLLAEPDFESGASTNFTTEARTEFYQNSAAVQRLRMRALGQHASAL